MAAPTERQPAPASDPGEPRRARHLLAVGPGVTEAIELPAQGALLIGRSEDADVRLGDAQVSRHHARLHVAVGLEIEDLGSANGTYVRDELIAPGSRVAVQLGEVIGVGGTVIMIRRTPVPKRRAREPGGETRTERRLLVEEGDRTIPVRHRDIEWIGSAGNYVEIHLGGRSHLLRETLTTIERRLDPASFLRVHRKTIVNIGAVKELARSPAGWDLVLKDGARLAIARSLHEQTMAWLAGSPPD